MPHPLRPESRQTFWHEIGGLKAPFRSGWTWRRTQLVTNYFPIFARKWQNTATNCAVKSKSKLTQENFTTIWPWRELNGSVCVCGRAMGKSSKHGTKSFRACFIRMTLHFPFISLIKTANPDTKDKSTRNHAKARTPKLFISIRRPKVEENLLSYEENFGAPFTCNFGI